MAKGCRLFFVFAALCAENREGGVCSGKGLIANELSLKGLFFVIAWISMCCIWPEKGLM